MAESAEDAVRAGLARALRDMGVEDVDPADLQLEQPRDPSHGDLATNAAMVHAGRLKRPPRQIAQELADRLDLSDVGVTAIEVAGPGFLNFRVSAASLGRELLDVLRLDEGYGRAVDGAGERVVIEWVSANPTGPLHCGHGRQAALGDAIASLLAWTGWDVHREFYYNDAGRQMERLGESVWARYQQQLGEPAELPEDGYHGDYVADVARAFLDEVGDRWRADGSAEALDAMRVFGAKTLIARIRRDLADFRVTFDTYFRETSLYEEGRVEQTVEALRDEGLVYESEGAVWLRSTEFGDQKDRVIVKSDGSPTYALPDIAYHRVKWERGFRHAINVQGADHHGTVDRVRAGLQGLGLPEGWPEYVLHQMVTFVRDGEEMKLSKRAGDYTTLRELYEQVGVDVARYFFQMRKPEAHLVFDVDAALDQSDKNPVYKIQYAHARMHAIFRKASIEPAAFDTYGIDPGALTHGSERELIKQLAEFPERVAGAARARAPHLLCDYLERTAGLANSWYHEGNPTRNPELAVLVDDVRLRGARLALARGVQIVLRNGLTVLGITAPERMERAEQEEQG